MSIRFKVILPYLLLTIVVAVTGAYVVIRLVSDSLDERLSNQLLEAGRVVSDQMAQQEIKQVGAARLVAYTLGLSEALHADDLDRVTALAEPVAGGLDVETVKVFDARGVEASHFVKQADGSLLDVTQRGEAPNLSFIDELLSENNPDSPPRREVAKDPEDERYYYYTDLGCQAARISRVPLPGYWRRSDIRRLAHRTLPFLRISGCAVANNP